MATGANTADNRLVSDALFSTKTVQGRVAGSCFAFVAVMCDPGITLYLSTLYSEFAAVYFLYISLLGLVMLALENWRLRWSAPCLVGLIGWRYPNCSIRHWRC
ncbi:MAG: hypothetical protein R3E67_00320 [Pseudomonadales bacterium]